MDTQLYRSPQRSAQTVQIAIGYKTDKGRKRSNNEDSYAVFTGEELDACLNAFLVVADGMGGTQGGEVASNLVVNSLPEALQTFLADHATVNSESFAGSPQEIAVLLNHGVQQANAAVWSYKQQHPDMSQMGTTCVTAIVSQGVLTIGNIGDSRAYLLRQGQLRQLTEDHSQVYEQVKAGNMTPEQAAKSRFRNTITRHIGRGPIVKTDITVQTLENGDVVLLCSDGLTTEVEDQDIVRLLAESPTPQRACDRLVAEALRNGGSDNVTVVVAHYGAFTPLRSGNSTLLPEIPEEAEAPDEDEDITDPNQAWKQSLGSKNQSSNYMAATSPAADRADSNRRSGRTGIISGRSTDWEETDDKTRFAREAFANELPPARRGISPLFFGLLLLVALGEAAMLFMFWSGQLKPRQQPKPDVLQPQAVGKPTDKPLSYRNPVVLYAKPDLWEGILQVMPDGRLLVATSQGQELAITSRGTATPLLHTDIAPPPFARPTRREDGSIVPVRIVPAIAIDASGYRYELNPKTKAFDKYDPSGTLLLPDIGKGLLKAPANVAVDKKGNLYVIDGHRLKCLQAFSDNGPSSLPPGSALDSSSGAVKSESPAGKATNTEEGGGLPNTQK